MIEILTLTFYKADKTSILKKYTKPAQPSAKL